MTNIEKHLGLLGMRVVDNVTGFRGVVTSVTFDLYGCIQALVHPGVDEKGVMRDILWFDVQRLDIVSSQPVMDQPTFCWAPETVSAGGKGPENKPRTSAT